MERIYLMYRKSVIFGLLIISLMISCGKNKSPVTPHQHPPGIEHKYKTNYDSIQLLGSFNNWEITDFDGTVMELIADYQWQKTLFLAADTINFKFVPNQNWDPSFGTNSQYIGLTGYAESVTGMGTDLRAVIPTDGNWRFQFNEQTRYYEISAIQLFTGVISGKVSFSDNPYPLPIATILAYLSGTNEQKGIAHSDTLSGEYKIEDLAADYYNLRFTAVGYSDTVLTGIVVLANEVTLVGEVQLQKSTGRNIVIDGYNDFLPEDIVGIDANSDMTEPNLDVDTLWAVYLDEYWYIGFNLYASSWGVTYGIYIFTNSVVSSGATQDPWNRLTTVATQSDSFLPPYALYIWHKEDDTVEAAQLCSWDGTKWSYPTLVQQGGEQAYDSSNNFIEYSIPTAVLNHPDSIFIELFTTGGEKTHPQDTSPTDPNVNFTSPDWKEIVVPLSADVFAVVRK